MNPFRRRAAAVLMLVSFFHPSALANTPSSAVVTTYGDDGTLEWERRYRDGKQEGVTRRYYPSGKLQGESVFRGGVLDGVVRTYSETGSLLSELQYQKREMPGPNQIFW